MPELVRFVSRHRTEDVGRKLSARIARRSLRTGLIREADVGNGITMSLRLDRYLDSAIYFFAFERATVSVLERVLRPGDVMLEVGALATRHDIAAWADSERRRGI
jgi:hypothetical protein